MNDEQEAFPWWAWLAVALGALGLAAAVVGAIMLLRGRRGRSTPVQAAMSPACLRFLCKKGYMTKKALKRALVNLHPDRGGSNADFIFAKDCLDVMPAKVSCP